jgi:hypothetical protein
MAEKYSLQGFAMERLATLDHTPPPIDNFPGITVQPAQTISANWSFLNNGPGLP